MNNASQSIDEFIAQYPEATRKTLEELRQLIKKVAPEASEKISYGIPTFTLHGNLIHFSAYEKHIGLYPGPGAVVVFAQELEPCDTAKGTIRFPLDQPLPFKLIEKIVLYCVKRNKQRKK